VTEAQQLWNDCSDSLRSQVSEATWKAWFASIRPVAVANGTLVLAVPSGVVRDRLEGRFHGLVHDALLDSSGKEVQFRFDVQIDDPGPDEPAPKVQEPRLHEYDQRPTNTQEYNGRATLTRLR